MSLYPEAQGCSSGDYSCATGINYQNSFNWNDFSSLYVNSELKDKNDKGCQIIQNGNPCMYLADGMIMSASLGVMYGVNIDVNGIKGPNKEGRDQFRFVVSLHTNSGVPLGTVMPYGSALHKKYTDQGNTYYWKNNCTNKKQDFTCTARVLEEGKMAY